jgi:hypothetical protein
MRGYKATGFSKKERGWPNMTLAVGPSVIFLDIQNFDRWGGGYI